MPVAMKLIATPMAISPYIDPMMRPDATKLKNRSISAPVHCFDLIAEFFLDHLAADLHRGRNLTVIMVELLVEQSELADVLDPRELGIDLVDLALDQFADFR